MFVQVFEGKVGDAAALKARWEEWVAVLAGADGWLGATGGVTEDGTFVAAVRFDSEDSGARSGRRPEQEEWWTAVEPLFQGPVTFIDCPEVDILMDGSTDRAGFVQMMHAHVKDRERLRAIERESIDTFRRFRPDFVAAIRAWHDGEHVTAVDYFTSEADARAGEEKEMPPDVKVIFDEWFSLLDDLIFLDLPDPWLASPSAG